MSEVAADSVRGESDQLNATGVSVIIPTLNRSSLGACLDSVLLQSETREVLLINDSGKQLVPPMRDSRIRIVNTSGRTGAANARNAGMVEATQSHIAFLDDDDMWLPGHLDNAMRMFAGSGGPTIVCARVLVLRTRGRDRIEPVELLGDRSVADYFYGRDSWRSRCRRIPCSTFVFTRDLLTHHMDPNMTASEDTWWLLTAQLLLDACVRQSDHVGAIVCSDMAREDERTSARDDSAWAQRLESVSAGAGPGHLLGVVGRQAVRAGKPREVLSLASLLMTFDRGWSWIPTLTAEIAISGIVAAGKRLRG